LGILKIKFIDFFQLHEAKIVPKYNSTDSLLCLVLVVFAVGYSMPSVHDNDYRYDTK
jgi:hypothetical protein